MASERGYFEVIKLLVDYGAVIDKRCRCKKPSNNIFDFVVVLSSE
jgi:hypothetical protein